MDILFDCYPTSDLRVIPIANIITRACLAPCFLDGKTNHHTIPHRFRPMERRHFDGGQTDTAAHIGKGSKLYELNLYAMTLGRPKERAVSVADELANNVQEKRRSSQGLLPSGGRHGLRSCGRLAARERFQGAPHPPTQHLSLCLLPFLTPILLAGSLRAGGRRRSGGAG